MSDVDPDAKNSENEVTQNTETVKGKFKTWLCKVFDRLIDKIGKNKSEKILLNPWTIKLVLVSFISLIVSALITLAFDPIKDTANLYLILNVTAAPFLILYFSKGIVDDYQGRLVDKDIKIGQLEFEVKTITTEFRSAEQKWALKEEHLNNIHEIERIQLIGNCDLKQQEIDTLKEYPEILLKYKKE